MLRAFGGGRAEGGNLGLATRQVTELERRLGVNGTRLGVRVDVLRVGDAGSSTTVLIGVTARWLAAPHDGARRPVRDAGVPVLVPVRVKTGGDATAYIAQ